MKLTLDYNIELFPLEDGQSFALALASSLSRAGSKEDEEEQQAWRPDVKRQGLDDDYDYVMYGKVCILLPLWRNKSLNAVQIYKYDGKPEEDLV
jgi:RNA polymerase Rpb8